MHSEMKLEQAQSAILERTSVKPAEWVSLWDAWGRITAHDLEAPHPLPAAPQSAVDGYALGDAEAPTGSSFAIKGTLKQYEVAGYPLLSSECVRVSTGGALPDGAGAVVPHERTLIENGRLIVQETVKPGNNVKQAGEDYQTGEILAPAGSAVDAGLIALMAAFGYETVEVHQKPRVAVLSLGANIVPHSASPAPGQVRDSNGPMLAAMIRQAGAVISAVQVAGVSESLSLVTQIGSLLQIADLLIITGGSYAPEHCEARDLMEQAGAEILYWDVAVQPGSHQGSGIIQDKLLLSLSGNPAACAVGFHLFAAPVLKAMQGVKALDNPVVARCINGFPKAAVTRRLVRAYASVTDEGWAVEVLAGQKPSMLRSLVNCNSLIDLPAGTMPVKGGEPVAVRLITPI